MRMSVAVAVTSLTAVISLPHVRAQDPQAKPSHAEISAFGSSAAQEDYFDCDHSDFRPSHWLTEPGTLKGQWLAPGQESVLQIRPDPSRKEDEGDVFVMQAGTVKWPFESSYGSFAVFGCDVDGDRIDEVVIEDGWGRGTCVYQRRLTILKLLDGRWQSILREWLSAYLPDEQPTDITWQRRYRFYFVRPNKFDVVLHLVPPVRVPLSMAASEDYAPLQHPRCVLRYSPEVKAFRIWDETFVRPPGPCQQPGAGIQASATPLLAPFATDGNIWVTNATKKVVQLTSSGKDRAPTASPDGRHVAFIRKSKNHAYLSVGGEEDYRGDEILADQIWVLDTRNGKERLLVEDRMPSGKGDITKGLQRTIAHIDDDSLCFSPDGAELYFISSAWVVSGALHVVNIRTGREHFLDAANSVEVVQSGKYAGHLMVNQHRYFLGIGSFDWYWLMAPRGREIGPVGESYDQVETFKEIND